MILLSNNIIYLLLSFFLLLRPLFSTFAILLQHKFCAGIFILASHFHFIFIRIVRLSIFSIGKSNIISFLTVQHQLLRVCVCLREHVYVCVSVFFCLMPTDNNNFRWTCDIHCKIIFSIWNVSRHVRSICQPYYCITTHTHCMHV